MLNSFIANIAEIIYRLGISDGMNINELSKVSEIRVDILRDIVTSLYELPFGGILLEPYGLMPDDDVMEMPDDKLYKEIKWKIDLVLMDKIPVNNLELDEKIILTRILKSLDNDNFIKELHIGNSFRTAVFVKGTSTETSEIFKYRDYFKIRNAFIKKMKLHINLKNDPTGKIKREVAPLGMVFQSEKQKWYLVAMLDDSEVLSYDLEEIEKIIVLDKHFRRDGFDLKEYLKHCFDLDLPEMHQIEVVFENYGNIIQKVRRKLSSRGTITERKDGSIVFTGALSGMDDFRRWILGFGSGARVIKPLWLAQEQMEEWRKLVDNYSKRDEILSQCN